MSKAWFLRIRVPSVGKDPDHQSQRQPNQSPAQGDVPLMGKKSIDFLYLKKKTQNKRTKKNNMS